MSRTYVFAYGSLMNPASREKTLPGKRKVRPARLCGYQRKMNAPVNGYLYLNIAPSKGRILEGILIPVREGELEILESREAGYERVDVTSSLAESLPGVAYAFIAPAASYPKMKIPRTYLITCMKDMDEATAKEWLANTVIENEIEEDLENPKYEFFA